ncbi:hypothetical protein Clacol_000427 [Clathrus columnatus]|uniref:Sm domain-containing protein n=1 Tax=Clathrus columnatus TaxID=1419009 RepID=A0AAV4ZYQ6_9AGAM|nr:hypothetical protein Clacol_000427 [Clathrus columnatus]
MVTVYSYMPSTGQHDTCITTYIDFSSNVQGPVRLRLVFGDLPRPTIVETNSDRSYTNTQGNWTLKAYVPLVEQVSAHVADMTSNGRLEWPLTIQALDSNNTLLDSVVFGVFSYDDYSDSPSPSSSTSTYDYQCIPKSPEKHQYFDTNYPPPLTSKRAVIDNDTINLRRLSAVSDTQACLPLNLPNKPRFNQPSNRFGTTISPQTLTQQMSSSSTLPQSSVFATGTRKRARSSPVANTISVSGESSTLIRTSQLGNYHASEPAVVTVRGNLESMKESWTDTENQAHRRLVQFWKRLKGNTLEISFAPILQSSYKENTIVVSCIHREDIDDYFITSVDVIYLLESLAGNRFEVEEKNRIRRNLEGFKPLTISKTKPGTEDFFRIIMEFPLPRPRNIEKDVKVFEWGKLKGMLDKVFSKYSIVPVSSSKVSPTSDTFDIDLQSDSEDKKPNLTQNEGNAEGDWHLPAAGQLQKPLVYPEPSLDQTSTMEMFNEGGYEGVKLYDHSTTMSVGGVDNPMVKSEYPSYSPLLGSYSRNGSLGRAYEQLRAKSPPSSDNSPLSATLSISSAGSSDGFINNEASDVYPSMASNNLQSNTVKVGFTMLIFSVFKTLTDQTVTVELKNDLCITGVLKSVDQFLNIRLDNIRVSDESRHPHMMAVKNCFIRGSVVRYVQLPAKAVDVNLLEDATRRGPSFLFCPYTRRAS